MIVSMLRQPSGCEYAAAALRPRLTLHTINAMAESFFATLECELLARRRFASHAEARVAIFRYVEGWYNPHRRHSALGHQAPITYERAYAARPVTPTLAAA